MKLTLLGKQCVGLIVGLGALAAVSRLWHNYSERSHCASLQKQGVKAYLSEGLADVKCHVIQRDMAQVP